MEDHIYITVLTNISEDTPVQERAEKVALNFVRYINLQPIKSDDQWQKEAYMQFHLLLGEEITKLQQLQKEALKSIMFNI